ncbi:replication initiation protein [Fusobacterium polymorphum]|uniref:replication initiation protein n=1 Tax=Fusobacterium nucleatum subsp. polymorphum TaxID=76857 RepID=UPI0030D0832D
MEIIEKQEIVKFHNDLNKIKFNEFNLYDYKIFFVACVKVLEKGDNLIEIDFSELRKILELTKRNTVSTEYLENMILETANKLSKINFNIENRFFKGFSTLFTDFYIPKEGEKKLYVKINDKTKYILNNLVRNFTLANLQLLNSLASKYSYRLYLELKQFENIDDKNKFEKDGRFYCWRNFEIENFREIMDIPESYKMNDIDKRVLKPSLKELEKYFEDIFITKVKKLRKVTNIIFYFIFKKDDFTLAVNKNISPLEEYFNLTFITVKYTNAIKNKLEELLEKNSLAYVKKWLEDNWTYISNNKSIKDKAAYFSNLITSGTSILTKERKEKLDQIEKKKEVKEPLKDGIYSVREFFGEKEEKEEFKNILPDWDSKDEKKENTNTITSLRDLQNSYFEEIPEDQKIEVTKEEYNELLNKFIEEKRKIVASSGRKIDNDVLKSIFKMKEGKKYKIVTEKTTENIDKFEINIKSFSAKELTKLENYLKQYRIKLTDINNIKDKKTIDELKNFIKKELKQEEKFENYDAEIERSINNESSRYQYLYDETTVNELFNGKKLNEKGQEFWEKMVNYFDGEEFFEEELTGVNGKPLTGGKKEFIKAKLVREYAVNYRFDF